MNDRCIAALTTLLMAASGAIAGTDSEPRPDPIRDARIWAGFAGGPARVSVAHELATGPNSLSAPRFVFDGDGTRSFVFYGQTAVAVGEHLVIAVGYEAGFLGERLSPTPASGDPDGPGGNPAADTTALPDHGQALQDPAGLDTLVAFSRIDGTLAWTADIPIALLDSWSAPFIDSLHGTVIAASGATLSAFHLADGSPAWTTSLGRIVVNASPAATYDLPGRNRVFITDYSYAAGQDGRLLCINTDPYHATDNPFQPGEIVWSIPLGGQTSGNTPAYRDGVVYVSTATGGAQWDQGTVRAYPATADTAPEPLWVYEHTAPTGFFSGVAVKGSGLYASSYSFHGGQFSAETVRLNAGTGQQIWSVATNRTDTTPVPIDGGLVLVSGGVPFNSQFPAFGSLPSLQLIVEHPSGAAAVRLWDSAMDTLNDANQNSQWDPGETFLSLGGWTIQPVVMRHDGKPYAFVGQSPDPTLDGFFGSSPVIAMVDLTKHPADPGFLVEWGEGSGASPGLSGAELYTVGQQGVSAYGAPRLPIALIVRLWTDGLLPDFNADDIVNLHDLQLATQYALGG